MNRGDKQDSSPKESGVLTPRRIVLQWSNTVRGKKVGARKSRSIRRQLRESSSMEVYFIRRERRSGLNGSTVGATKE